MANSGHGQADYGTGQKKLSIYIWGMIGCVLLTIIAFSVVMSGQFTKIQAVLAVYSAAFLQFLVQIICFLRLNVRTEQGVINVIAFVYTLAILICIILGSLWIMANLDYYMVH